MKLIRRNHYMDKLYSLKNTPDIKIITGVKRCGKSCLLNMFIDELRKNEPNSNIIRIDFNDSKYDKLKDGEKLHTYIMDNYKSDVINYLFIYEIQMCNGYEYAINSLHASEQFDIYLTGSNAFLLSSDLATLFTGRYMEINVFPFSLKEFKQYYTDYDDYELLDKYLEISGVPGFYIYEQNGQKIAYINNLIDAVILKDLIKRNSVSNEKVMNKLVSYLMDNISNFVTPNKIANYLTSKGFKIDHKTVDNYLEYLSRAFVFYKVKRYDIKRRTYLQTNDKYYLFDPIARIARLGHRNLDLDRVYENIVAIELLRRGYDLYVGKLYQKEVDFIALKCSEKNLYSGIRLYQ